MTQREAIQEAKEKINKKRIEPKDKYYYDVRYKDGMSILKTKTSKKLYVTDMFDLYGPFTSLEAAHNHIKLIRRHTALHRQAEVNSWEGDTLGPESILS